MGVIRYNKQQTNRRGLTFMADPSQSSSDLEEINDFLATSQLLFDTYADTNLTLSGIQTINEVTGADGVRVLVNAQSDQNQNGGYVMRSGAWDRVNDSMYRGVVCVITGGSIYKDTMFIQSRPVDAPDGSSSAWFRRVDNRQVAVSSILGSAFVNSFLSSMDADDGRSALGLGDLAVQGTVDKDQIDGYSSAVSSLLNDATINEMRNTLGLNGAISFVQPRRALPVLKNQTAFCATTEHIGMLGSDNKWYRIQPDGTLLSGIDVGVTTLDGTVVSNANRVVIFNTASTTARVYSTDGGATWNNATNASNQNVSSAAINTTTNVICAKYAASGNTDITRSTDGGATWADVAFGASGSHTNIATDNVNTWLIANNSSMRRSTDDGATWASVTPPGSTISRLAYTNGRFIIYDNTGKIHHSTTGATGSWTTFEAPSLVGATNIYYRGSKYFFDFAFSFDLDDPTSWNIENLGLQLTPNRICFLGSDMYTIVNKLLYVIS